MDVKAAPARVRSAWQAWWYCHKQWRRLRQGLEQAGVARYDPVYPLIIEIGMVPARMGRLLVVFGMVLCAALLVVEGLREVLDKLWEPVTILRLGDGGRLVILDAPRGARWQKCPQAGQLCVELLPERGGSR